MCAKMKIRHAFRVPYLPKLLIVETMNLPLIQMISSYIGLYHTNWANLLQYFAYALRTGVHESTSNTPAELFFGRPIIPLSEAGHFVGF